MRARAGATAASARPHAAPPLLARAPPQPSRARRRGGCGAGGSERAIAATVVARASASPSSASSDPPRSPRRRSTSSSQPPPASPSPTTTTLPHLPWLDAFPLPPNVRAPNVLSFEPRAGAHGGRHWVPPERHSEFLDAYAAWWAEEQARAEEAEDAVGEEGGKDAGESGNGGSAIITAGNAENGDASYEAEEGPAVLRPLTLAEAYGVEPYRYFQEFDLDWSLDPSLVLRLVDALCEVVADEAGAAFGRDGGETGLTSAAPAATSVAAPLPRFVVSMRTPYKVHLNFPEVVTNEARARAVRQRVTARLRAALGGSDDGGEDEAAVAALALAGGDGDNEDGTVPSSSSPPPPLRPPPPALASLARDITAESGPAPHWRAQLASLDWRAVVDAPHGSLRLPGSRKSAAQRDRDPAWVSSPRDKYYLPVVRCAGRGGAERQDGGGGGGKEDALPTPKPTRQEAYGPWRRVRLSRALLDACSIRPTPEQLARYEASAGYLEGLYLDAQSRRAARRAAKARKRARDEARREAAERAAREEEERRQRERAAEERYRAALAGIGRDGGVGPAGSAAGGPKSRPTPTPPPQRPALAPRQPSPPPKPKNRRDAQL